MTNMPKISLVVPNLNCAEFLEQTITSIVNQSYPNLELILSDGGSTDGSLDIVEKYRGAFTHIISEPDTGQANAVNKGFALATGEVMGWINSDDVLMPGGLGLVGSLFALKSKLDWVTGKLTTIDEAGRILASRRPRPISYQRFLAGDYQWVQQESTFWRRSLWDKAGGQLDERLSLAVDGELWLRFSRYAELIPVHDKIGAFRFRTGQRSEAIDAYHAEMLAVIANEKQSADSPDAVTKSVLAAPTKLRSWSEADSSFPGLTDCDPKPIKNVSLWKHRFARVIRKL
ncbi:MULTISPECIES: glycosyltransferase family 2 protein [unclassified Ruegeria]|uniref:glycosyltransferase family 2 protein n=1 Tax=unclassified Ruegeria TaxID=2625375 RepID=UPI001ADA9A2B|nr:MULTISPECIES: glycosyltransferase family 2 protein [unclassified Ruegeria]MBO9410893.1 glycosyltransferase [Ruegeria sp. R8_1]MBO9415094.1 glycosyltransferase [Ruegeria sp. R8_2]